MNVYKACYWVWIAAMTFSVAAQAKPPLLPERKVQQESADSEPQSSGVETSPDIKEHSKFHLGIQFGVLGNNTFPYQPFLQGETLIGARVFSRISLGGRWYLMPSVGYYGLSNAFSFPFSAPNLLQFGADLNYALFRFGPVTLLAGLAQRVEWRFYTNNFYGSNGTWAYRVGPGVNWNIRINDSMSVVISNDVVFTLSNPVLPELGIHGGILFGF